MSHIKTTDDIKSLGTILGIWAHPDDETFTMGGIMAAAVRNGQKVACVTATRGEKGVQDEVRWPASRLGQIRTDELMAAMKILGVEQLCWLDYPDGDCKSIDNDKAVQELIICIEKYSPDSILTFGKDGLTGHSDHCRVSCWAEEALQKSGSKATLYYATQTKDQYKAMKPVDRQFNFFFNIDRPPLAKERKCAICLELPDDIYELKHQALKAMPSQYEAVLKAFEPTLQLSLGIEAFVEAE